jgi:hypothetical protein
MANFYKPPLVFLARATSTAWQDQLRTSVRLYLSLSGNPAIEAELEALLRRNEQELLDYLLAGDPPTPAERRRAQEFLDSAQHQLLGSPAEVQQMLAELSAESVFAPEGLHSQDNSGAIEPMD